MKKAVVAILVLIIGVVLAVPFAGGLILEKTIRNAFDEVNGIYAETGTGYSLEIIDYDRGYLSSVIHWKVDLGILKSIYPVEEVVFVDHARHGFTGVTSATSLEKNPWYADFVEQRLQGRDPLHITTRYRLSGSIESTVALDPFSFALDGETLDVSGGSMVMTTDRNLENFTSAGTWDGLSAGKTMTIGKTIMASTLKRVSPYIWAGNIGYQMRRIDVRDKTTPFELVDLQGDYTLSVSDDRTKSAMDARFSLGGMTAGNKTIGKASLRVAVSGLDTEGYEAFMKQYTRSIGEVLGGVAAMDKGSQADQEAVKRQVAMLGFQMMAAYEKLLKQGLEVRISNLAVKLPEGDISGSLTLRLLKDMTFVQFAPVAAQPDLLFGIFYLKSDLSLPAGLVGENPKLLTPAFPGMQTGLFVNNGGNLVHRAETVDGKLILNGVEVALPGQHGVQPAAAVDRGSPSGRI